MRVISLHNSAKFGCFISINDKIINNLLRWGRFQPNFRRPLTKLWMGAKKVFDLKGWHGPPLSPCKISWKSRDARRRNRMKCDVFHFIFSLFVTLHGRRLLWCVIDLLPQDIASTFVGRFRCRLHCFFAEEKHFPAYWTVLKIFAKGRYDWCPNGPNKIENLRKWVQSLCAPLRPFRSKVEENFYHSLLPHVL